MNSAENHVALMLGSNLGDSIRIFRTAIGLLERDIGKLLSESGIYISEPWGFEDQPLFHNQALVLSTQLQPEDVLEKTKAAEQELGRVKRQVNGPREIDIDILFYNDFVLQSNTLTIPHPRMHLRKFNLVPLNEIASDWIHPVLRKSVRDLEAICKDPLHVRKIVTNDAK